MYVPGVLNVVWNIPFVWIDEPAGTTGPVLNVTLCGVAARHVQVIVVPDTIVVFAGAYKSSQTEMFELLPVHEPPLFI